MLGTVGGNNELTESFNPLRINEQMPFPEIETYFNNLKKNEIRQIIKSYHQTYDHLHEILQNAIDACELAFNKYIELYSGTQETPYEPKVDIYINADTNELIVNDNGMGMTLEEVQKYLFTPYATNKRDQTIRQRGEKGVGNAFLAYGSNGYHFTTRHMDDTDYIAGRIGDGIVWALGSEDNARIPVVEPADPDEHFENVLHGTTIKVIFSEQTNIKRLSDQGTTILQWEAILRIHTSVGYIDLSGDDSFLNALKVNLHVTHNGVMQSKIVQKGYLYPHKVEGITHVKRSDLQRGQMGRLPTTQTMKHCIYDFYDSEAVKEKALVKLESYYRFGPSRNELREDINTLSPSAYVAFNWSNEFWDDINRTLFGEARRELDHGIVFATKTQRIAEPKKIEFSFRSGDYNRFHIVLDMRELEADIGRKSLERRVTNLGSLIADAYQQDFVNNQDALRPNPRARREDEEATLEKLLDRAINSGVNLSVPSMPLGLGKIPREEQDVVALFFNLLGNGAIKGYTFFSTLISQQYDGVGYFDLEKVERNIYHPVNNPIGIPDENFARNGRKTSSRRNFIEFKLSTDGLIRDIKRADKQLRDIKWLVCWEKGNLHTSEGISIDEILEDHQRGHREYYGVTDLMRDQAGTIVHVIRLEKVIEILSRG